MSKTIHPVFGGVAFLMTATFWVLTVGFELVGTEAQIIAVKSSIPFGLLLLIPAMAIVGGSGHCMANGRQTGLLGTKAKRMRLIAANGMFVLVPSALFLAWKAQAGALDRAFYAVQAIELAAGAINLTLLGISIRDGLVLTRRLPQRPFRARVR